MRALLLLILLPACALLPSGGRALSLAEAQAVLEGAADDVGQADLNGDGLLQLDSDSGAPLAAVQGLLRSSSGSLAARDGNGDGMLDSRELLGAAPFLAARIYAAKDSLSAQPAQGDEGELVMLGLLLADRLMAAL